MTDLGKSFDSFKDSMFINRHGCLLTKEKNGYSWKGILFATLEDFDDHMKLTGKIIGNSIKKGEDRLR